MMLISKLAQNQSHLPQHYSSSYNELLYDIFGLQEIKLRFNDTAIEQQSQQYASKVSFETALYNAMDSFINDASDMKSPLALVLEQYCNGSIDNEEIHKNARHILMIMLNSRHTMLSILDDGDAVPQRGEKIEENWIFVMRISELSDHIFWAIVPRHNHSPAYNYGFS